MPPPPPPPPPGGGVPASGGADIGGTISYGWNKFTQNVGPVLIALLIPMAVNIVVSLIAQGALRVSLILYFLIIVVGYVVVQMANIGIFRVSLQIVNGEQADVQKAFQYDRWGEWVVFSIIFGLIVGVGFALCIIPGILALGFLGLAPYFFLDGRQSLGDALSSSSGAGLFGPVLVLILVGVVGALLCGIGIFLTAPIGYIGVAALYKQATGQQAAA